MSQLRKSDFMKSTGCKGRRLIFEPPGRARWFLRRADCAECGGERGGFSVAGLRHESHAVSARFSGVDSFLLRQGHDPEIEIGRVPAVFAESRSEHRAVAESGDVPDARSRGKA